MGVKLFMNIKKIESFVFVSYIKQMIMGSTFIHITLVQCIQACNLGLKQMINNNMRHGINKKNVQDARFCTVKVYIVCKHFKKFTSINKNTPPPKKKNKIEIK